MSIIEEIEQFAKSHLPNEPHKWCRDRSGSKIVHDALWGTFEVAPHEVALIDTPLFQRLRFIHQTGAVHLTYPSALHTRFEHTLGVMFQASQICSSLRQRRNERGEYDNEKLFDTITKDRARFAALVHDTGHGPFSHTSEQYFSGYDEVGSLKKEPQFRESGAGEILSCLIIKSEPFRRFVRAINDVYRVDIDVDVIANMITGNIDDEHMYLSEIVHGPFDADKIDYMHRDGMFSGLRMHVDVDRLYSSINVVSSTSTIMDKEQTMRRLSGSMVGTSPLSQIMFNKMLLFTGIYHHHKVRSVDCMLWAIFEIARNNGSKVGGFRIDSPVDFLKLTDDRVLTPELTDNNDIVNVIKAIRERVLWKRALVISRHTALPQMHDPDLESNKLQFQELAKLSSNRPENILRRRKIAMDIWERAKKPCAAHEIWFDVPKLPSMEEAERMWITAPGLPKPVTLGEFLPIQEWVELYGAHQWRAHVFCPSHVRKSINAAAIEVMKDEFDLHFNEMATGHAHIDRP